MRFTRALAFAAGALAALGAGSGLDRWLSGPGTLLAEIAGDIADSVAGTRGGAVGLVMVNLVALLAVPAAAAMACEAAASRRWGARAGLALSALGLGFAALSMGRGLGFLLAGVAVGVAMAAPRVIRCHVAALVGGFVVLRFASSLLSGGRLTAVPVHAISQQVDAGGATMAVAASALCGLLLVATLRMAVVSS